MSASASTTSSVSLRSPAARACRDVMQCVFAFLSLTELVRVARCCVQWDKWAVLPMGRTDEVKIMSHFPSFVSSRLLRHVSEIALINDDCKIEDVNRLRTATSQIRRLDIAIDVFWPVGDEQLQLPASLTDLTLAIDARGYNVVTAVLDGVCNALSLRILNLSMIRATGPNTPSLVNILRLTQLESLTIGSDTAIEPEHLSVIKQMTSLRHLDMFGGYWFDYGFATLVEPPHALTRLQDIRLDHTYMNKTHVEFLQHVPTLTRLAPQSMTVEALRLLRHRLPPACVELSIRVDECVSDLGFDAMRMIDLTRIKKLCITHMNVDTEEAVRFLSTCLPSITELQLACCHVPLDLTRLQMPTLRKFGILPDSERPYQPTRPPLAANMPALTAFNVY